MLAGDGLPLFLSVLKSLCRVRVSATVATPRCTHQKAAPIWLPCRTLADYEEIEQDSTHALTGLEMNL
jgi:hypothetical protein